MQSSKSQGRGEKDIVSDITVFGATGFVGKYICSYLVAAAKQGQQGKPSLRLTLAGRNLNKLEARKDGLDANYDGTIDLFVADSGDADALKKMAERTQIVLNCAGPFIRYGTNVVAACAETGTDYVDITGEITWVGRMRAQYGPAAKRSGARIISLCGFDSVPSDISILEAVQSLRNASGATVEVERGVTWHSCKGAINGGTLHSALEFPVDLNHAFLSREEGKLRLRKVPFLVDDPMVLTHPTNVRHSPDEESRKDKMAANEWWNQLLSFDSIVQGGCSLPFFMAAVNAKVVHASAVALNYGPSFTYRERFFPMGFKWTRRLSWLSVIPAVFVQGMILATMVIFGLPVIGKKLADWILPPGSGLSESFFESCHTEVYAEVTTKPHETSGKVDRATCFISFQGDPGNLATAQCVSESALSLLYNRSELPPRSDDGFGTPAELLGPVLLDRLKESKVRLVKVVTSVRQNAPKDEHEMYDS